MRRSNEGDTSLRCSFCHKSQKDVGNLISSPSDYPRAYICYECILVCAAILEDNRPPAEAIDRDPRGERNPLLDHPLASAFLTAVERWIGEESVGAGGAKEFAEMRSMAIAMIAGQMARASKR
jgi:hypothetical protein